MIKTLLSKIGYVAIIAGMAVLTFIVFNRWGIAGSAALICFWGLLYGVSLFVISRKQQKARNIMANLSEEERKAVLAQLSEEDRAEILRALQGKPKVDP